MKIILSIEGMECEGCVNRIKKVLSMIKGIDSYDVSLVNKKLILSVKKEKIVETVIEKIENLGFKITS